VEFGISDIERFERVARNHRLQAQNLDSLDFTERIERIRGMLNKAVYTSAENWMKPQWVIHHPSEDEDEHELRNTSSRNHVVIGMPGRRKFARCDSSGLLHTIPNYGSTEFWLFDGDKIFFPALMDTDGLNLSLISPDDQIYEWSTSIGPVDFSRLIYHVETEDSEFILNEIHVKNRLLEPTTFTFYVVLRPMSFLGVEPIESIVYNENSGGLYANGYLAQVFHKKPTAVFLSTADDPNLIRLITIEHKRCDHDYSTIRGLATAIVRYDLDLGPAESQEFYVSNPLDTLTQDDKLIDIPSNSSYRLKTTQSWFEFSRKTMSLEHPNDVLQKAYTQAKASLAIQSLAKFRIKPTKGESTFWRENVRILLALLRIGCDDIVCQLISESIKDGTRADTHYEFSVISPIIWMLTQYVEYTKDYDYLEKHRIFLNQWFDTIFLLLQNLLLDKKCNDSEINLESDIETEQDIPSGIEKIEDNDLGPESHAAKDEEQTPSSKENSEQLKPPEPDALNREYIWTSEELLRLIWNYETIRKLTRTLRKEEKSEIEDILSKCKSLIQEHLDNLSFEPLEFLDFLSSISLLNMVDFVREKMDELLLELSNKFLKNGLVAISTSKRLFSSHHALRIGHYYTLTNQRYMVEELLYKTLEVLSEFYLLPEFVNPKTKTGSAGDGCSSIAAADMLILLRDMLAYESEEDLVVLSGIPEEWYSTTTPIIASAIRTEFGKTKIELGTSANQYQIELSMTSLPREFEVHVPHSFSMPMIKVFGAGIANRNAAALSPNIRVVPLSESVILTAHK
jgi:hypothetical protein